MNDTVATLFVAFLTLLIIAIIGRSLLSWFPGAQRNELARMLYRVTDPLIDPVRRFVPAMGGFDFSPMIVIIVLWLMIQAVREVANA